MAGVRVSENSRRARANIEILWEFLIPREARPKAERSGVYNFVPLQCWSQYSAQLRVKERDNLFSNERLEFS